MNQAQTDSLRFAYAEIGKDDEEPPGKRSGSSSLTLTRGLALAVESPDSDKSPPEDVKQNDTQVKKIIHLHRYMFRRRFFPSASTAEWNDWQWQIRNRIMDVETLSRMIALTTDETDALTCNGNGLPFSITPYYASLIDPNDPSQALRKTMVPVMTETVHAPEESGDPLGEDNMSPVPGLVHRYPDRVLFLTTQFCSAYCRYCTRSRIMNRDAGYEFNPRQWDQAIDYIAQTPVIRDVVLSGGDPMTLSDDRLEYLLSNLRRIPHVEMIRIGTKVPAVLPQRVTSKLVRMLKKYHPLYMSVHFTHPDELTPETSQACNRLADAGIPLGSQTVLLAGVNDDVDTMKRLMQGLLRIRVRPYYLYQCDPIIGSSHFRTPVRKGLEIIRGLRGHTSGYAVPSYVIDAPGGGGKIPILPDYVQGYDGTELVMKNYQDRYYRYPDCDPAHIQ